MKVIVKDNLHTAEPGSYFRGSVMIDGDFLVPPRTFFWRDLVVTGKLFLCPESHVAGNVTCNGAVICHDSVIEGKLNSGLEQLTVCDNATGKSPGYPVGRECSASSGPVLDLDHIFSSAA